MYEKTLSTDGENVYLGIFCQMSYSAITDEVCVESAASQPSRRRFVHSISQDRLHKKENFKSPLAIRSPVSNFVK